jgi:hypothetical protein
MAQVVMRMLMEGNQILELFEKGCLFGALVLFIGAKYISLWFKKQKKTLHCCKVFKKVSLLTEDVGWNLII